MAEAIISDWISDYSSLQESELRTFAAQHENDFEISKALYTILNERAKYKDLIYPVCNQLCSFYRSSEVELRRFTLQFVPILIYLYLNSVTMGDKKGCRSIETLLICIYNIEVSADDGSPKVVSFRIPVLAQASIYHEEKSLLPSDLRRWEENSNKEISWGPLPSIESINAQNRLKVMTALLFTYNQQLNQIRKPALYHLCKTTSQLATQGFAKIGHVQRASYGTDPTSPPSSSSPGSGASNSPTLAGTKSLPRIAVSSQFLVELAHANYFAMFNEFASAAIEAVKDLHQRACYEMLPEVILVTNAIRNSLHANPSGQPSDGPMGISVALTPATTTVTVSKSMITNASFRTKKLPDDLEVEFVNSLQSTQQEMMNKLATIEGTTTEGVVLVPNGGANVGEEPTGDGSRPEQVKKKESRKWKNWGWKSNANPNAPKQSSIEEEAESPKKSNSSRHSSPVESPKHKLLLGNGGKVGEDLANSSNSISPASLRRKKFLTSKNQSPVNRSEARASAGARLYEELDSLQDSDEELQALIVNGRPATIHLIQPSTIPDDIPIQGPKEENGQLSSINEESESGAADGGTNKAASTTAGKTKDSKTHKVLVGFKKLKDKDKDKDDGGGSSKKSSGVGDKPTKEKLTGKQSLQMQTGSAELIEAEKTSPLTMAKRKSTSVDVISVPAAATTTTTIPPMANGGILLGSGGGGGGDDKDTERNGSINPLEVGESFDSGNEMTITNNNNNNNNNHSTEKSVLEMKSHGSIQVSQV
ncbi:hyccin isoform X2 [Culex pipiens pallens]|uniref:hyccin isoform X2 n=1 Tax=Culex pipiens pallens TaxID=42434 RepID=UPI001952E75E|nr:hyccin isoform X2 [Culex pipiens pallens]